MTARRPPDFDLDQAIATPSFTPRRSDVPALLSRVAGGGEHAPLAERALLRVGEDALRAALERANQADPPERARLTRFLGKLAARDPGEPLIAFLASLLADPDERVRRAAASALGKARPPATSPVLADALARESAPSVQRALIEALGKIGDEHALAALDRLPARGHVEPVRARARLMAERTLRRAEPSTLDAARSSPGPVPVILRCRAGLERFVMDELDRDLAPRLRHGQPGGTRIAATLTGSLDRLFRSRAMLSFAFELPEVRVAAPDALADAIITALTSAQARRIFAHYTRGNVRYRLAWARGGKRRAMVFRVAEAVHARCPELINDPTDSTWDVIVHESPGAVRVELAPRVVDPRFAYRRADVPASSHPTIAAALARAAGVRADDVVWDPFVGSGLELCERALLGPYRRLIGSDLDPAALTAARANLSAAGVPDARCVLVTGDAAALEPPARPTLIITNPPLGRRVKASSALVSTLERFIAHAARVLAPGGRLVWMSPSPGRTDAAARRHGLLSTLSQDVDMGGFTAVMQRFARPA